MHIGLVPKRRSVPPKGATISPRPTFTKWMETRPASAARSAQSPMRPIWPELRRVIDGEAGGAGLIDAEVDG